MNEKKGLIAEFKEFIAKGNVMDMAVGVIIGAAFKAIIDSVVNDILMPIIGIFIGAESFTKLNFTVGGAVISFGNFVSAVVNFLIMALVLFLFVRTINRARARVEALEKKKGEADAAPAEPSNEEKLLTEIRDLLKKDETK